MSHGCAGVDIADQQLVDHSSSPAYFLAHPAELLFVGMLGAEILSRRLGVVIIQAKGNLRGVSAQQRLIEDPADDVCRLRVKLELVADRGMQNITIGGITAHILALFHHLYFCRSGFDREIFAVCRVDYAAHHHFKATRGSLIILAVIAVVDGYEANAHEGKGAFQIVSGLDIVTRKAGEVLDADQIDFPALHFFHHGGELRTLEVCAGVSVISELQARTLRERGRFIQIPVDEHTLVGNAVAFGLAAVPRVFVGQREANVDANGVIRCRIPAFAVQITSPPVLP